MESSRVSPEKISGLMPNLTSSEDLQTNSFAGSPYLSLQQTYLDSTGSNTFRCEETSNSSNIKSFDEILRDIIETSKYHVNQTQHQSQLSCNETTHYSCSNVTEGFHEYPSYSQPLNLYSSQYSSAEIGNSKAFSNINPNDNYERLIDTVQEDNGGKENFQINIAEADSTDACDYSNSNHFEILRMKRNEFSQQTTLLPPFNYFPTSYMNLQPTMQYTNQYIEPQSCNVPSNISSSEISRYPFSYSKNKPKVFSPKILPSCGISETNLSNGAIVKTKRTFSNTMPPPFSVSNSSAFKTYRKKSQKNIVSNATINSIELLRAQQSNDNKETIVLQPANVFIVSQESVRSGEPEWIVEKMYVSPDLLSVKPPLQTENLLEQAKEAASDILFNVDFSSLDTSNIIIPNIQIKGPLHKNRKQELKVLQEYEITDNEKTSETTVLNSTELGQNRNIENNSQIDLKTTQNLPDQNNISSLHSFDGGAVFINNKELKENDHLNDGEISEDSALEKDSLPTKSLKCHRCNKTFKYRYTLKRHNKNYHLPSSPTISLNESLRHSDTIELITPSVNHFSTTSGNLIDEKEKIEISNNSKKQTNNISKGKQENSKSSAEKRFKKDISETISDKNTLNNKEKNDNKKKKRKNLFDFVNNEGQTEKKYRKEDEKRVTRSRMILFKE
ncbi:uncharacterized protein LOC129614532 [Condylostylus longicornis]|uniref:uncharacterized protein LOC129614532 n=1 Tax=Condylostylus longicornis TaxID=2530218 RepID=UPI00244DFB61|nr:uncharacterized protein LOC129614532 [Condylostylus longicornis]